MEFEKHINLCYTTKKEDKREGEEYMSTTAQQSVIYIGLNDSETGVQKYDTQKYLSILKNTCRSYKVAFSVQEIEGGYFHEDGRYTEELTLVISLIDASRDTVNEIAQDLGAFFHQESVLITENKVRAYHVNIPHDYDHLHRAD